MTSTVGTPLIVDSDDALAQLSNDNPGYRIEREEDGSISLSPTFTKGGAKSAEACGQLRDYRKIVGGKNFDSSTGFRIGPRKKTRSPDASWISQNRIDALKLSGKDEKFWPISPDVVIEIKSDSDDYSDTVKKIKLFHKRGSVYAVAIDPATREVQHIGTPPEGLSLDFDAIIDA